MTRDDALDIVGMVLSHWPTTVVWTVDETEAYAHGIVDLNAADVTLAVVAAHRTEKYRPAVAVVREYAAVERRKRLAAARPPEPTFDREPPRWAAGWGIARYRDDDWRVWPEQKPGYDFIQEQYPWAKTHVWPDQELMPDDVRERYESEGAALTVVQLAELIGRPL